MNENMKKALHEDLSKRMEEMELHDGSAESVYEVGCLLDELLRDYHIMPKGDNKIFPEQVLPGDLIRAVAGGDNVSYTRVVDTKWFKEQYVYTGGFHTYYLIERSVSVADEHFWFPGKHGAVIRLTPKDRPDERTVATRENNSWRVAGESGSYDENELRANYFNFEVVSS